MLQMARCEIKDFKATSCELAVASEISVSHVQLWTVDMLRWRRNVLLTVDQAAACSLFRSVACRYEERWSALIPREWSKYALAGVAAFADWVRDSEDVWLPFGLRPSHLEAGPHFSFASTARLRKCLFSSNETTRASKLHILVLTCGISSLLRCFASRPVLVKIAPSFLLVMLAKSK